ncbi:MAG: M28 family peptidase [Bacteroidetes bacterium]|nr:M28 family peptidase [Bacteroidota bacterium]
MKYLNAKSLLSLLVCISNVQAQESFDRAKKDIEQLTSKEFAGRSFVFDGHAKACAFLKDRYREIGLSPVGDEYGQSFDIALNVVEGVPSLLVNGRPLALGADYLPFATTGSGTSDGYAPIFYVKSGLFVPDRNINDFNAVKSQGAILIFEEEIPQSIQADKGIDPRNYSRATRIEIAKVLKASAAIFLVSKLSYSTPYARSEMPVFDVLKASFPSPITSISFNVTSSVDEYESENVVGLLKGTGSSDSIIIICAHYDHVGGFADSLYFPGANDNASGTAMLLSLAEYFKANPVTHSILFISFSGEETGLIGSKYYSENPLLPLEKTKFLLNLDMVASGDDGVMAVGGEDFTSYFDILNSANDSLKLGPLYKRWNAPNGDHYFISQKDVKAFFLYANQGKQPYHSFQDTPATLDWKAFNHIYQLSKSFIQRIGN